MLSEKVKRQFYWDLIDPVTTEDAKRIYSCGLRIRKGPKTLVPFKFIFFFFYPPLNLISQYIICAGKQSEKKEKGRREKMKKRPSKNKERKVKRRKLKLETKDRASRRKEVWRHGCFLWRPGQPSRGVCDQGMSGPSSLPSSLNLPPQAPFGSGRVSGFCGSLLIPPPLPPPPLLPRPGSQNPSAWCLETELGSLGNLCLSKLNCLGRSLGHRACRHAVHRPGHQRRCWNWEALQRQELSTQEVSLCYSFCSWVAKISLSKCPHTHTLC